MVEIIERNREALGLSTDVSDLVGMVMTNEFISVDILVKNMDGLEINDGVIVGYERFL